MPLLYFGSVISDPVCAVWTDLGVLTTKVMQDKWWKDNTIKFPSHVQNTTVRT